MKNKIILLYEFSILSPGFLNVCLNGQIYLSNYFKHRFDRVSKPLTYLDRCNVLTSGYSRMC